MEDKTKGKSNAMSDAIEQRLRQGQLDLLAKKALEHDKKFEGINKRLDAHDKKFETLQSSVDEMKNEVLTALDKNTVLLEKISLEQDATTTANIRRDEAHDKLDKRVVKLEKKSGIIPAVAKRKSKPTPPCGGFLVGFLTKNFNRRYKIGSFPPRSVGSACLEVELVLTDVFLFRAFGLVGRS